MFLHGREKGLICLHVFQANDMINTSFVVSNCELRNNTADGFGGGIATSGQEFAHVIASIADSELFYNEAKDTGGGVYSLNTAHLDILHTIFKNNKADVGHGGGVYLQVWENSWRLFM